MIDNNQTSDLSRLFRLCQKIGNGLKFLETFLKKSIVRRGQEINSVSAGEEFGDIEAEDRETEPSSKKDKGKGKARPKASGIEPAIKWVQDVLNLKDKFDSVWKNSFEGNRTVESALNEVSCLHRRIIRVNLTFIAGFRNIRQSE